ncbi:MAG: hypothetical protein HC880_08180 [Bacteroidia bacterium]|nr:hypothetical protein [Bacteroidia bacterium]
MFVADLIKSYIANKITQYLTPRIIALIDRIAGLGLIGFGIRLLFFAFYG